jgi:hypothetical protein
VIQGRREEERTHRLGDIVNDDGRLSVPIVHGREGAEALLSSGVPDLELDDLVLCSGRKDSSQPRLRERERGKRGGGESAVSSRRQGSGRVRKTVLTQSATLSEKGSSNGRFLVRLEVVLAKAEDD